MAVKLGGEEPDPAHLTVGDNVHARVVLVAQGHIDGVVLRFEHILRPVFAALRGGQRRVQPRGPRVRSDHTGGQKRQIGRHGALLLKEYFCKFRLPVIMEDSVA